MKVKPNFNEVVEMQEPGTYVGSIAEVSEEQASTGTSYLKWVLNVKAKDGKTFKAFHNTPLEGKGAGILKRFLEAAMPHYEGGDFDPSSLIGVSLKLRMVKSTQSAFLTVAEVEAA